MAHQLVHLAVGVGLVGAGHAITTRRRCAWLAVAAVATAAAHRHHHPRRSYP